MSAVLEIIFLVEFGQLGLVAIQATRAHFNSSSLSNFCKLQILDSLSFQVLNTLLKEFRLGLPS